MKATKEQKLVRIQNELNRIQDKFLKRNKLTDKENELQDIQFRYGLSNGSKEILKRNLF